MNSQTTTESDETLMVRFREKNDRKAFDLVYNRHFSSLCKYLSWLTQERDTAADIAQNIFLKLLEQPTLFDPTRNFKVWLFSSAKNQWKNELRNRSNHAAHLQELAVPSSTFDAGTDQRAERLTAVLEAVKTLNETHREVFVLKYSNNLSIQEISQVCQLPEGTVKSRLFNALQQLKSQLKPAKHQKA